MNLGGGKAPIANPYPRQSTTVDDIQRLTQARSGVPAPTAVAPVLPTAATITPQVQTPNVLQSAPGIQWYNPAGSGYTSPQTTISGTQPQMSGDTMNSLATLINMFRTSSGTGLGK
jgi:hypothetical protein